MGSPAAATGHDTLGDQFHNLLEVLGAERAVGRGPAGEGQKLLLGAAFDLRRCALCDQLLREDVQAARREA